MKILFDACISSKVADAIRDAGHVVTWVGDWDRDPGDDEILAKAHQEKQVLITLDKDFGELAIVKEMPHCGILRLVDLTIRQQIKICLEVIQKHERQLQEGAILTAEPGRLRIRSSSEIV